MTKPPLGLRQNTMYKMIKTQQRSALGEETCIFLAVQAGPTQMQGPRNSGQKKSQCHSSHVARGQAHP